MLLRLWTAIAVTCAGLSPLVAQPVVDPQLEAAVQQFFALQQAEDVDGYLALWSSTAKRPTVEQLKFVFASGDDTFADLSIVAVVPTGDRVRVIATVQRERTMPSRLPGGAPRVTSSRASWSLLYIREGADWKLLREGSPIDALADSLMEAATPEERAAIIAANPQFVNEQLAIAVSRLAGQAAQQGAHAIAQGGYERMLEVARAAGSARFEGEALQNLANAMYFQRNFAGALESYEQRLALERRRDDQEGIAGSLLGIATVRYAFADYGAAMTSYREALAIQEKLGDDAAIATTLISTGNILYLQGEFEASIADYGRSRDLYKRTNHAAGEANALEGMGRVLVAQGDYPAALEAFEGVLAEAKTSGNRDDQGTALLSIGDVHFRLGNADQAWTVIDEARGHFEAIKSLGSAGRAWQGLGQTDLAAARFARAEDEYRKSAAICATAADGECAASATVGLAFTQAAQEKFVDAVASYRRAIAAFTTLKRRENLARAEVGLSQALTGSGDFAGALAAASSARATGEAIANDDVIWRARVAEGTALRRLRDRPGALAAASAAVEAVTRLAAAARVRPSSPVPRDSSGAFAFLALLQAEDGDGAQAFETAERMRAHDLRTLLAPFEREIARGMTPAERDDERTLALQQVSLYAQLSREKTLPKPDAARITRLETASADAARKREAQQAALFARLPELQVWRGLAPAATREDLASLLPDAATVLLEFIVGDDTLLVLIARRGEQGLTVNTLIEPVSRRALADRVARLMLFATMRDASKWRAAALEFVPGLSAVVGGATRATVIPHEVLWRVPFEALPLPADDGYLADATSFVYAPSVTALVRAPSRPAASGAPARTVLAGAAPLDAAAASRLAQVAPEWIVRTPESAAREIEAIAGSGPDPVTTTVVDSAQATEAAVRERIAAADVIHVAAPFRINSASPLFSSVLLAPDPANDAALEAREVMSLALAARLAVVSDGAAMTMRDASDDAGTIAWAWAVAGVPALVLPRWTADEVLANRMLADLHARLRRGEPASEALAQARAAMRAEKREPFYWAGWMLIGR